MKGKWLVQVLLLVGVICSTPHGAWGDGAGADGITAEVDRYSWCPLRAGGNLISTPGDSSGGSSGGGMSGVFDVIYSGSSFSSMCRTSYITQLGLPAEAIFGAYHERTLDLEVKVQGGHIRVYRTWQGSYGTWSLNPQHENLST